MLHFESMLPRSIFKDDSDVTNIVILYKGLTFSSYPCVFISYVSRKEP